MRDFDLLLPTTRGFSALGCLARFPSVGDGGGVGAISECKGESEEGIFVSGAW